MAQSKTIQLLRSSSVYANLEAAKTGIQSANGTRQDGELLLGRYWSGTGANKVIKSVIGIYHANPDLTPAEGETITAGWTFIQDITSSTEGLQHLQDELDATQTGAGLSTTGSYVVKTGDTIIGESTSITDAVNDIADYIQTMDLTAVGGNSGDVITTVSQADGKVSASKSSLTDVAMTGYAADSTQTGSIAATDTLEQAFNKVENAIAKNTVSSNDKTITIDKTGATTDLSVNIDGTTLVKNASTGVISSDLKILKETTNLESNVKEQYKLVYGSGTTAIGDVIKVYKDSALLSVKLLHATDSLKPTYDKANNTWTDIASASQTEANLALCYAYEDTTGTVVVEAVPVGNFLRESEFKNGLQVVGGEVSVLVDPTSESVITSYGATSAGNVTSPVLSVSPAGVKVSNIQAAIDAAVQNASDDLAVTAAGDNVYISAAQDAQDNKKINVTGTYGSFNTPTAQSNTLSATTNGIAKAEDVATAVNTVIGNLDGSATATAASGNVYTVLTSVTETDGVIAKGSEVTLAAVAKTGAAEDVSIADSGSLIAATNVEAALQEIAGNLNAAKVVANDVITVDITNNTTKLAVTTGNGLEKNNNTLSVKQGDGITVDSNGVAVNTGSGLEINSTSKAVDIKIDSTSAKQGDGTTGMLTVSDNGLKLSDTWDCGTF